MDTSVKLRWKAKQTVEGANGCRIAGEEGACGVVDGTFAAAATAVGGSSADEWIIF